MITVTEKAAAQILLQAKQSGNEIDPLRIAVRPKQSGGFDYLMGFDNAKPDDTQYENKGIKIVVSPNNVELLKNMEIDFVELENEGTQFIFKNPQDPNYKPPTK